MILSCAEICRRLDVVPPPETLPDVSGVATLTEATEGDLCFVESADQHEAIAASAAALVLAPPDFPEPIPENVIRVPKPRQAFFAIAELFLPPADYSGIHADASIDPSAVLGRDVTVAPGAVLAAGVRVGDGSVIGPSVYLGPEVEVGQHCVLHANVSVQRGTAIGDRCVIHPGTSIGGDGFGYQWDGSGHRKVPQLGRVVIEEDCELGSNVCVDRATLGTTRVGRGTKIDNLVQIAHNVRLGEHVIMVAQSGIAGSTRIGTGCIIAGQAAISDHLSIGDGARIGGQAGVTNDVAPGTAVNGTPARAVSRNLREQAALGRLPTLLKEVKRQQRLIEALEARLARLEGEASGSSERTG
ncbi:UDP-3-O-(3-hydroxymyristoyl)glucosamine N-acyltransferase [Thiorhodococcus mannitoliphagus]|uniref:UDP-3-O-acylglucosamine N-acyltransferase n=1 Tax=Thiorhodococcus mannitoliphagus TaxID=329406 RepID=A0A6P1E0K6_9GAMM|nr:UDP-3-O-(3-hydroxymyristoyl)glucosamine N-acyltransferase [Thiorhodococcus mannitoliphagus]NEX23300.1 UDP-3-O-(3-hydroxymyristoyl)glucosamine N-acyltransferase [Thiorhodococcus mannitoliphagus]